jgi:ADP-heptose:LPS heptosyltransferase
MARTWPVTRRKRFLLSAFDRVAGPVSSVILREKAIQSQVVRKILVIELWHMGDVILATPVLQCLRSMYPDARITLLAKDHARELLEASGLVDDIVTFDFPWTATSAKYNPARYDRAAISRLVRGLRNEEFDLSLDCRMDLRSNALTRSTGAKRRIGYDFGGGGFLLTDALPAPPPDQHKVDDWMGLLRPLRDSAPGPIPATPDPLLTVTESEQIEAFKLLEASDISPGDVVVGIHPGGSHEAKRWSVDNFAELGRTLREQHQVKLIVFVDPEGCGGGMQIGNDALFVRTSIREMMALFTRCNLIVCNDSGPMHAAAALAVPVVAIFRTGNPRAYGPRGLNHTVVGEGAERGKTSDVPFDEVISACESALSRAGL